MESSNKKTYGERKSILCIFPTVVLSACVHSVMSAIMWGEYMCWQSVCLKRGVSVTLAALSLLSVIGCTGEINGSCP